MYREERRKLLDIPRFTLPNLYGCHDCAKVVTGRFSFHTLPSASLRLLTDSYRNRRVSCHDKTRFHDASTGTNPPLVLPHDRLRLRLVDMGRRRPDQPARYPRPRLQR